MTLRRQVWRGAVAVSTGQVASQALSLTRNILVARLLSPWDVGVAAALAVTLAGGDVERPFGRQGAHSVGAW